ncbi:ABC transporter substrate-binding protein [Arthrobacter sp. BB-1]|uniref:ABC transporter substrate-binding protein n=1 Tax=Micrococcaceae TaxID=1268 RepID=UPI00111275D7|nr:MULTISPECIES: ABC transporter substrate-binding protein [Micrococcaceae]TNB77054.1 ABC transporter substrate-binding protein [Arthrobacter sp. BB-1]UEL28586.1 ABC transporter substrate-binding protein [Pseudarthrobacter sp. L1SW]
MSNPIDVGSVLGGRYKVTATVLASHDHDLVLDGVDQVLNRPVSILVAGPGNTEQVAQSAREVATGERPGTVQVLDLGMTEAATYLITNHTSAADLLDLVVASNPPYVEPFFTDTLGSEIFGQPRSHEPEPYDDEDHVEAGYINYSDTHPSQVDPYRHAPAVPPKPPVRPAAAPSSARKSSGASAVGGAAAAGGALGAAGAAAAAGSAARNGSETATRSTPTQADPTRADQTPADQAGQPQVTGPVHGEGAPGGKPKVSLWSDDDYAYSEDQPSGNAPVKDEPQPDKKSSLFARSAAPAAAGASYDEEPGYDDDRDEDSREPRSMRWLVGGLLAVVLIAGLVFAVTNLGSLLSPQPQAVPTAPATNSGAPATTEPGTQAPPSAPPAVPPAIENISRQGNFDFAAAFDGDLVKAYDGNAASYWSDMEFATENWGGLAAQGVPLVVKLKSPAKVSSITLSQLGGSGGNITVYTNDRPALDGAKAVGTNSFTSTDLTMPLAEPVQAQYVIVSINSLPRLAAPKTRYGYGIRLAEIKVQ